MSTPVFVIGLLASIFIPLAFLPQTIKIIRTKDTKGISIGAYSIYFVGVMVFFVYAILLMDIPMIVCQTINGLFAGTIFSITLYNYLKKKEKK